ncbi:M23 family metallopeptidase [Leucobacter sp. USHLN153]|uniref:M23 family metallopeptidase n=1 Tax=Leucobacter sp. USHLN153 TaxID=3081268 RepID=UPI0030167109
MSAPAVFACAAVAVGLGLPVVLAATHVESAHRAAAAADAAALAAADSLAGFVQLGEPCDVARMIVENAGGTLTRCDLQESTVDARIVVAIGGPLGAVVASAHAGLPPAAAVPGGEVKENGWAWPSGTPGVTQGFHDGYSIDLRAEEGSALYAPYGGTVVAAGADGGGIPAPCLANPSWWHGPNHTVVIRHEYRGSTLYSSHNHVAPGSPAALGLRVGAAVRAGQTVALAGMSGCSSGPHTHFTLSTSPTNAFPDVNPYLYIGDARGP